MKLGVTAAGAVCAGVLGAGAAAAPAALSAPNAAAAPRCPSGLVAARIAGKRTCLKTGQRCKRRLDGQYHRYRFHCHSGRLTRVTVAEARWVARIGSWATGFRADVNDSLAFVPDWLAQRDPDSLAQLTEFANVLQGCSGQLASFGQPTRRFRPVRALFAQGCSHFSLAGGSYAQLVLRADPALATRAREEAVAGTDSLRAGLVLLARLPR